MGNNSNISTAQKMISEKSGGGSGGFDAVKPAFLV